jgi:hypothetical protein
MAGPDFGTLGVLAPDSSRTILVIADDGELAVAIRERVDRAYALVKDVRPDEATEVFATCIPWPWMVIGNGSTLPPACLELFANRPILIFWRGQEPPGLPRHTRVFSRFNELADAVTAALDVHFLGRKLAAATPARPNCRRWSPITHTHSMCRSMRFDRQRACSPRTGSLVVRPAIVRAGPSAWSKQQEPHHESEC